MVRPFRSMRLMISPDQPPLDAVGLDQYQGPFGHGAQRTEHARARSGGRPFYCPRLLPAPDLGAEVGDQGPHPGEQHPDESHARIHREAGEQQHLHGQVDPDRPGSALQPGKQDQQRGQADQVAQRYRRQPAADRADHRYRQQHHDRLQDQRRGHHRAKLFHGSARLCRGLRASGRSFRITTEQRARRAGGDDRAGDDDPGAGERVGFPVDAPPARPRRPARSRCRWRRAGSRRCITRSGPNRSAPPTPATRHPAPAATRCGSPRRGRTPAPARPGCRRRPCRPSR